MGIRICVAPARGWLLACLPVALLACLAALVPGPAPAGPTGSGRPFDFSDAFYRQNGIDPTKILNRVAGTPPVSKIDNTNTDPNRRNVRVLDTTGGFNHEGNPLYYNIFGMVMPSTFTNDAAGQKARDIANFFSAYIFPKVKGDPLSPALSNR